MNHKAVCGDDGEVFVTMKEGSSEIDLIYYNFEVSKVRGDPQALNHFEYHCLFFLFVVTQDTRL